MNNGDVPPLSRSSRLSRLTRLSRHSSKRSSNNNFSPSDILPQDGHKPYPNRPQSDGIPEQHEQPVEGQLLLGAPESDQDSNSPPKQEANVNGEPNHEPEPASQDESDEPESYDLNPPAPKTQQTNIEATTLRFFSADHLDLILRDTNHAARLRRFLDTFMPRHASALTQYVELRKAFAAIEYANAIAHKVSRGSNDSPLIAANYDETFGTELRDTAEALVEEALPAYLTNRLVSIVTESLVKDIIGNNSPFMKELVPNLAEVYCITDPSAQDNPIVYASEGSFETRITIYVETLIGSQNSTISLNTLSNTLLDATVDSFKVQRRQSQQSIE